MKLPRILLAMVVLVFAMIFGSDAAPAFPNADRDTNVTADKSVTVASTSVDANSVSAIECQARTDWVRESVGRHVLNIKVRIFEPTKELAGYRTVIERPKIAAAFTGIGHTRPREQV